MLLVLAKPIHTQAFILYGEVVSFTYHYFSIKNLKENMQGNKINMHNRTINKHNIKNCRN